MKKKFGLKATLTHRLIAKGIDFFLVFAAGIILPKFVGPFLGFAYSMAADGMVAGPFKGGQSVGKWLMGLQVVSLQRGGQPANYRDSIVRNIPIGIVTFFAVIPVWGWLILLLVGIPLIATEIYLMIRVETSHRLGDVMGDTEVVEVHKSPDSHEPT